MKKLLFVALLCLSKLLFAQPVPSPAQAVSTTQSAQNVYSELLLVKEQNLLLKEQIKVIREYHSSLLDTVYASLAAIVTTAGFLLTVNFFSAWRTRSSDRALLTQEFDTKSNKLALDLDRRLSETQAVALETYNSRTDSLLDRVSQDFIGVRQELLADRNNVAFLAEKFAIQTQKTDDGLIAVRAGVEAISKDLDFLEATLRDVEVKIWEIKDNVVVMLMTQAQSIAAAGRAGRDHMILTGAKKMIAIIEEHFIKKSGPELEVSIIQFILARLPNSEKHAEILEKVRQLVKSLPSVPDSDATV